MMKKSLKSLVNLLNLMLLLFVLGACSSTDKTNNTDDAPTAESIVIFTVNDLHGKIDNFGKVKAILDEERKKESQVFFVAGGDLFSGNPIVDFHPEKGFPIIDLMNRTGIDVSALGNHEFDYGQEILNARMQQASFPFLSANVKNINGELNLPEGRVTIEKDGFEIAFIGVVETSSPGNIPSTHPKRIQGLDFEEGVNSVAKYRDDEEVQNADLVIALTHYGSHGDEMILQNHDFVDLVIGGHNHDIYNRKVNGRYMVQSGSNLRYMTKLSLEVLEGEIVEYEYELVNLDEKTEEDAEIMEIVAEYNNKPEFYEEIGTSLRDHNSAQTGCFYTDALRTITGADIVFQNYGGIRAGLDFGKITPFDIYTIDPFGNGLDTFSMSVKELKEFLEAPDAPSMAYSGLKMTRDNGRVRIYDPEGRELNDEYELVIGLNDYISNVHSDDFTSPLKTFEKTTAEYLIEYLKAYQSVIDYEDCNNSI
ncbi:bifunctional metallophosphatase/5'-nucleotidase [Gramella sp. GC03-9]|uniref:Bifunctional metallophosphatase/5'-nucleotidase n=1 Tax=Christiangramia oceanisediminis TaxID=2920386 RepID=A0A9X2I1A8_9FLAO|nr:bifunctional UDP-sugar hydrolase/5'-nucleotidase [Gramella oceanisediminis]MCP9199399.1 bifunctional metallophosphatase/5'-nucleotidase [Gramella oceanisediminis]